MAYFVYIIQSQSSLIYYKGFTQNPQKKLWEHNNGFSRFTKGKGPWNLVFLKEYPTKKEALLQERKLKKVNSQYLILPNLKYPFMQRIKNVKGHGRQPMILFDRLM